MSGVFSVRLRRFNGSVWETAYTFEANPFVSPEHVLTYNDLQPPVPTASTRTWTLKGKLSGTSSNTPEAWDDLVDTVENPDAPVQGVQLLRDGMVVEEISTEGGYSKVKIDSMAAAESDTQWVSDMAFTVKVSGIKYLAVIGAILADLTETLSYEYDDTGLLTKTLTGELAVKTGSAEAVARTYGLQLPGADFAYVTDGPEGVDVEVLDQGDTKARFTSVIRQSGAVLPAGVAPGFSVEIETSTVDGQDVTTTTVSADGPQALAAVKLKRPSKVLSQTVKSDTFRRTARAVYVQKKPAANATPMRRRTFTTVGGGRPVRWFKRTGGRTPRPHFGLYAEVIIDEVVTLERNGSPELLLVNPIMPPSIADGTTVVEDTGGSRLEGGPDLIEKGKDSTGDLWQVRFSRRYTSTDFYAAFLAVSKASIGQDQSSTLNNEVLKRGKGKD